MATFQITGPDGKKYRVTGDSPEGAMSALKKMVGEDAPAVDPATGQPPGVPEFVPPGVENYNKETGLVQKNGMLGSAAAGAADVATMGFGDEASAGIATLLDKLPGMKGQGYGENLAEIRGNQAAAQADNPKSYLAGQIGGGIAQGVAAGPGIMANAPTLLGKAAGGALTGGAMGGVYGAGSGTDAKSRITEALKSGAIGVAVGGAFPIVAAGAAKGYRAVADAMAGNSAAKQVGTTPEVLRMLGNTLDADGTLGPVGQANMARAGQDAMLADAGPNAKAILDTAIQRGGPGAVKARQAIGERTGRAATAINDVLDETLGKPGESQSRDLIVYGDKTNPMSLLYKKAYETPIDYSHPSAMDIEQMVKTRVPHSAIKAANELMRVEGNQSKQILAHMADDGSVVYETLPDVRQLDYITRGLNEVADRADGMGKLGGTTPTGRAYANLSREIRNNLKEVVPEYKAAVDRAATEIGKKKAVDFGADLLSAKTTMADVKEFAADISNAERLKIAQGVRSRLDDLMANVTRTVQDGDTDSREAIKAIKDLSSRANREKLETVLGAKAGPLFDEIDRAATSFDLRASVAENSKTYARLATSSKIDQMTQPGWFGTLLQGRAVKATQRVAQALTEQTPERITANRDAVYSQIAEALTRSQGQNQPLFNAIQGLRKSDAATQAMADRITRAISGPHLAYPSATLLREKLRQ